LSADEILKRLRSDNGYWIRDFGTGPYLREKYQAYKEQKSIKLDTKILDGLVSDGLLKVYWKGNSYGYELVRGEDNGKDKRD